MAEYGDVTVLLPTLDEAATVADVVDGFYAEGFEHVLVIDGGSADDTPSKASSAGATVVSQSGSGKGQAIREAVTDYIDTPYVLMADADATYRPEEAHDMVEPLIEDDVDHVIGNRFANMAPDAMTKLNYAGNQLINRAFAFVHGRQLQDILSGYRAFTRESFQRINPRVDGFGVETELAVGCVKHDMDTAVVPIHYDPRPGGSSTNLHPVRDGFIIMLTLYRLARTNNPLFYFGSVGLLSTVLGLLIGTYVGYRWFVMGVSHEVLAVVAAFGILFGVQLVMFGVLSDLIVTLHRETLRRIDERD